MLKNTAQCFKNIGRAILLGVYLGSQYSYSLALNLMISILTALYSLEKPSNQRLLLTLTNATGQSKERSSK